MLKRHLCHGFLAKREREKVKAARKYRKTPSFKAAAGSFVEALFRGWRDPDDNFVLIEAKLFIPDAQHREWVLAVGRREWNRRMTEARKA